MDAGIVVLCYLIVGLALTLLDVIDKEYQSFSRKNRIVLMITALLMSIFWPVAASFSFYCGLISRHKNARNRR